MKHTEGLDGGGNKEKTDGNNERQRKKEMKGETHAGEREEELFSSAARYTTSRIAV